MNFKITNLLLDWIPPFYFRETPCTIDSASLYIRFIRSRLSLTFPSWLVLSVIYISFLRDSIGCFTITRLN